MTQRLFNEKRQKAKQFCREIEDRTARAKSHLTEASDETSINLEKAKIHLESVAASCEAALRELRELEDPATGRGEKESPVT